MSAPSRMKQGIGPVEDHRNREGGALVYPVYSRRSGGLSAGINLFPDRKTCSFDCPYCEVFPFETDNVFHPETMKAALLSVVQEAREDGISIRDICFSGSGEPTLSVHFAKALAAAAQVRDEAAREAELVLITNGSGLLDRAMFDFLADAVYALKLHIWLKLDAGTEEWYAAVNRTNTGHGELVSRIREFAGAGVPFIVQTMLCAINGMLPPEAESAAWVRLVTELAALSRAKAQGLEAVHIYGKARPAPEDPLAEAAPAQALEERAALLRSALAAAGIVLPVSVYP